MNDMKSAKDVAFGPSGMGFDMLSAGISESGLWDGARSRAVSKGDQSGLPLDFNGSVPSPAPQNAGRSVHLVAKRIFDVISAASALLVLLPLFVIVAALIKLTSKGPVFFKQSREGLHGVAFGAYKFRSMKVEECDISGVAQTTKDDPRVTVIGKFIRRTSIDELPQLLNVLRGEMSLVGPRPHVKGMQAGGVDYTTLVPYYADRLEMVPGITGWAQANGLRGPTDRADKARARVDHDIAYIQNFSFWLDLKIILRTLRHEFVGGSGH